MPDDGRISFPATRWSLIASLPGQPGQGAVLVGIYADAVAAYLGRKLAGERPERIEDVTQEVLLDLLARPEVLARASPGPDSRFRHYLMDLAWHSARNALRHARRRDLPGLLGEVAAADAPGEAAAMDRAWALAVVGQALEELRRWSRDGTVEPGVHAVLHGHPVEGRDLRSLGAGLGLSLATCSRRLARGRLLLRQSICERLRLAGELGPDGDPDEACTRLLALLR